MNRSMNAEMLAGGSASLGLAAGVAADAEWLSFAIVWLVALGVFFTVAAAVNELTDALQARTSNHDMQDPENAGENP